MHLITIQLKFSSIDTPRDFVDDTCPIGKLLMVREGLSDKYTRLCLEVIIKNSVLVIQCEFIR